MTLQKKKHQKKTYHDHHPRSPQPILSPLSTWNFCSRKQNHFFCQRIVTSVMARNQCQRNVTWLHLTCRDVYTFLFIHWFMWVPCGLTRRDPRFYHPPHFLKVDAGCSFYSMVRHEWKANWRYRMKMLSELTDDFTKLPQLASQPVTHLHPCGPKVLLILLEKHAPNDSFGISFRPPWISSCENHPKNESPARKSWQMIAHLSRILRNLNNRATKKKNSYFPFYWLLNRDPNNGLL